jgi:peptidyl-prolyl cis-trans isomerase SurA
MIRTIILGFSLLSITLLIGCGTSNPTVATIGDEKFTLHNFEDTYAKNNGGWDTCVASSLDDRQKFLDLIINFKLKVKEARTQGLEKDSAIISEMDTYNVSVAQSYMIEKEIVEPGVKQMYDRKKDEVRASHILFRLRKNATPEDTLMAYIRAMNAIDQIPNTPFDSLASRYSEDPSAKSNHGDLGFFTGDKMVPEFSDACYLLKPGEYTKKPIRSQYGYHVIKVTDRRPNPGSVRISHILLRFNDSLSDTAAVRDTVWMLYKRLKNGASFKEVMKKYSQDPQSVANNGDIGFYERDRIPPAVADVFFKLQIDSISEPMQFNYGYHIFKLTEKKAIPQFAEIQKELKTQYQQVRYQYEYNKYLQGLKMQYRVQLDSTATNRLAHAFDTTRTPRYIGWIDTLTSEMLKTPLITTTGQSFTTSNFIEKIGNSNEYSGYFLTPTNVWSFVNKMVDAVALEEHARHAAERHPLLAQLMKEYEEGVLLYRIEQDEVWKKVMVNDSLLKEYYDAHKEEYKWPDRVNFAEIYVLADSVAKAAYWQIQYGEDFKEVAQEYTNRPGYREKKGEWGFQPFMLNGLSQKASKMALDSITAPFRYQDGWSIIKMLGIDRARTKTFEEATPEVANGYQEVTSKKRELEWIEALHKKYLVTTNKEVLKEAFKRKRIESE